MLIARRHPHFGRLLAALATSQLGDWLYNIALLAYVQQRTHSVTWVGVTTAARLAPMIAGAPLGGLIADRLDRRRLLVGSDAIRAAIMLALMLVALVELPVVLVPLLAAAATGAGVVYAPTVAALTPPMVGDDQLAAANAARGSIAPVCVAAGPALGAVLLLIGSPAMVFMINALTFVASGLIVRSIPLRGSLARVAPRPAGDSDATAAVRGVLDDLRAGAQTLCRVPEAIWFVGADTAASFVYGAESVLLLVVAGRLGLGIAGYGYLLAAQGLGGILGAQLAGRLGAVAERPAALAMALLALALPLPVLAFTTDVPVAILVSVIAGVGALLVEVVADIRLQRTLEQTRLGCAYGFGLTVSVGGIAAGGLFAPILVSLAGVGGALCLIAAAVMILALVTGWRGGGAALARPASRSWA